MGYSEIRCTLCGVSFNIGRLRRIDEPEDTTFLASDGYVDCVATNGCWYIPVMIGPPPDEHGIDADDDDDTSYAYETDSEEEEEYEYESDDDLIDSIVEDQMFPSDSTQDESDALYETFLKALPPRTRPLKATPLPIEQESLSESERRNYSKNWNWLEHIAGPDCTAKLGYSGHRISLEQMEGCKSFQCLMKKRRSWVPMEDDEDFEIESDFFLTGLGTDMPSRDENPPHVFPVRHDADEIEPEDQYTYAYGSETALPFHPTCFEVYKHISRQKWGKVEIQRLAKWWYNGAHGLSPHPAVNACKEQWWIHQVGTEWLVANPVFVPSLSKIFKSAISDKEIDPHSGVFQPRNQPNRRVTHDPFSLLPSELSHMILSYLPPKDIATLRLVSREFEQLPVSFFYHLIRNEMPWLWEVWTDEAPAFWAKTTKVELLAHEKARVRYEEDLEHCRGIIKREMPEMYDDWVAAEPAFEPLSRVVPYDRLPRTRTNWYEIYRAITVNWEELKGLQNRRRIWDEICNLVLRF